MEIRVNYLRIIAEMRLINSQITKPIQLAISIQTKYMIGAIIIIIIDNHVSPILKK